MMAFVMQGLPGRPGEQGPPGEPVSPSSLTEFIIPLLLKLKAEMDVKTGTKEG